MLVLSELGSRHGVAGYSVRRAVDDDTLRTATRPRARISRAARRRGPKLALEDIPIADTRYRPCPTCVPVGRQETSLAASPATRPEYKCCRPLSQPPGRRSRPAYSRSRHLRSRYSQGQALSPTFRTSHVRSRATGSPLIDACHVTDALLIETGSPGVTSAEDPPRRSGKICNQILINKCGSMVSQ